MKKIITLVSAIIIVCAVMFYSLYKIISWQKENKSINNEIKIINEIVDINQEITEEQFNELKKINKDTVGYLNVLNTTINMPVVQTNNNDYYLNHSYESTKNSAGWPFLDYRNKINDLDQNSIIYAHGRKDGTMFGYLNEIFSNDYLKKDNHTITLDTNQYTYEFQVFSFYKIKTTSDYLVTNFKDEEYNEFLRLIQSRSIHDFGIEVNDTDKILTLSTCYNNTIKTVMHAKLISQEVKQDV